MFRYRVKNMEWFKDGNVLNGALLRPQEILIVTEAEKQKLEQSGATLEVLETLVPNPKKHVEPEVEVVVEEVKAEETVEAPQPAKKRGRPKKHE